ncbi:MAG: hypothetical protein FXF54_04840 [Kosmotoga sp.]|jgi:outer membrane protein assembly factor BamB|nr:MAG: hypothetical protein FXF54_04840 [Kosmotoga sp.]
MDNNDNKLIFANDARLMKLDSDGTVLWSFQDISAIETGEIFMSPSFDKENNIYFGTTGGLFSRLSEEGTKLWSIEIDGEIWTKPLIDEDMTVISASSVVDSMGNIFTGTNEGYFYRISNAGNTVGKESGKQTYFISCVI